MKNIIFILIFLIYLYISYVDFKEKHIKMVDIIIYFMTLSGVEIFLKYKTQNIFYYWGLIKIGLPSLFLYCNYKYNKFNNKNIGTADIFVILFLILDLFPYNYISNLKIKYFILFNLIYMFIYNLIILYRTLKNKVKYNNNKIALLFAFSLNVLLYIYFNIIENF